MASISHNTAKKPPLEAKTMFCVECGKETSIYKKGVCIKCYINSTAFTHGPEILNLIQCSKCGVYKYKNNWVKQSNHDIIRRIIKDTYKIAPELQHIDYNLDCEPTTSQFTCILTITATLQKHPIAESHQIQIRVSHIVCDVCSKQYGGYYEAILQIRADNRKLTKKEDQNITEIIENTIQSEHAKGNRKLFITDFAEEHGGLDFYLSERGSAYTLAKKIQSTFGGELKQSSSTVGMKEGREITRVTILLRLPEYQTGDFLKIKKKYYQIQRLTGQKIYLIGLSDWEEKSVENRDLKNFYVYNAKDYCKQMILVSQTSKSVQLMDKKNYSISEVNKPKDITFQNNDVDVFFKDDSIFLIPKKT